MTKKKHPKHQKNRRKCKKYIALIVIIVVAIIIYVLSNLQTHKVAHGPDHIDGHVQSVLLWEKAAVLEVHKEDGVIVPEKYDEHKIKARIIQQKIDLLKKQQFMLNKKEPSEAHVTLDTVTTGVHIFYTLPVEWYRTKTKLVTEEAEQKQQTKQEITLDGNYLYDTYRETTLPTILTKIKSMRNINVAYYPLLGLYEPTRDILTKHFTNIAHCGIGVIILSYSDKLDYMKLYQRVFELAPKHNLSITFEISVANNQSEDYLRQQLLKIRRLSKKQGFYHIYSLTHGVYIPLVYVNEAYKLADTLGRLLCRTHPDKLRRAFDALFIGYIRDKDDADTMRRLCFDGFYSRSPNNGATYASSWKEWGILQSFAYRYKMLFIPAVGPGFAERINLPHHGDVQRLRSSGRYYEYAWQTAIRNHVGFINIASYNNWVEGSQIEEAIPKASFLDYNPGAKTKYLDMTTYWIGKFLNHRTSAAINYKEPSCYELLNNTIC